MGICLACCKNRLRDSISKHLQSSAIIWSLCLNNSLHKDLTKYRWKGTSGDLSIVHDNNVLSKDWLKTHVTEQGFR